MINDHLHFLQEKCAQYWPSDGTVVYGDISIEIKREEENESYTVRDLLVTNNRVREDSMKKADVPITLEDLTVDRISPINIVLFPSPH